MRKLMFSLLIGTAATACQSAPVPIKRPDVLQCRAVCSLNGVTEVNILADSEQTNLNCKCK